ncbi:hypothetical protein D3C72_1283620 [compost metagenome]
MPVMEERPRAASPEPVLESRVQVASTSMPRVGKPGESSVSTRSCTNCVVPNARDSGSVGSAGIASLPLTSVRVTPNRRSPQVPNWRPSTSAAVWPLYVTRELRRPLSNKSIADELYCSSGAIYHGLPAPSGCQNCTP